MKLNSFTVSLGTIRSIVKIFPRAFDGYFFKIILLALLGFAAGLLEGIGITALVPLFNFFDGNTRRPTDFISLSIERVFSFIGIPFALPTILLLIVGLFFLKFGVIILNSYIAARIKVGYETKTMSRLLQTTLKADWPYLAGQRLGELETLIKIDAKRSGDMLKAAANLLTVLGTLAAYLLVAVNISQSVTATALVAGICLLVLYKPLLSWTRNLSQQAVKTNIGIAHYINETIIGIKTLKAFGSEKPIAIIGEKLFNAKRRIELHSSVLKNVTINSMQPMGIVFIAIFIAFTYYQTSYNLGALAALVYLIHYIFQHIQKIQGVIHSMSSELPYVENIVFHTAAATAAKESRHNQGEKPFLFRQALTFNNVSFAYPNRTTALQDISFTVKKNQIVGFIGPSGAGKTTIFDLILRLLQPTSGEITVDGNNIYSIRNQDWRRNIAYVAQDIFLLNDSIFNNIKFFDTAIDRPAAIKAAKIAQIYDFIQTLPQGLDTIVGERGGSLSTGQRQRIALARALAKQPQILLLDEATSSLDNDSEQRIKEAIDNLKHHHNMTILIIAHRLSTILEADQLLVVNNGQITESGEPKKLLAKQDSYFSKIYNIKNI